MPKNKPSALAALIEGFKAVFGVDSEPSSADEPATTAPSYESVSDLESLTELGMSRYRAIFTVMWGAWAILFLSWAVPAITSIDAWGITLGSVTIAYGFILWIPASIYIIASLKKVETYEVGGIMAFEKPAKEVGPGWHIVPLGATELHTYPINPQRRQYPAEPELIFKGPDDQALPRPEMVREIRATTHAPKTGKKFKTVIVDGKPSHESTEMEHEGDNLNVQKTIAITFFVIWEVAGGDFFKFYLGIPGESWDDKKRFVEEQIRDSSETDLVEQIAQHTLGEVLSDIEGINKALKVRVQENLSEFGIRIREARMQNPDISRDLNTALQNIAEAKAGAVKTEIDAKAAAIQTRVAAEAEKFRLQQIGEGEAAQILAKEAAKGEGQRAAADAMGMDPAEYRAGEVAEDALANNSTFVLGADGMVQKIIDTFTAGRTGGKGGPA